MKRDNRKNYIKRSTNFQILLKEKGLSNIKLAYITGLSMGTINSLVYGNQSISSVSMLNAFNISKAFGISLDELFKLTVSVSYAYKLLITSLESDILLSRFTEASYIQVLRSDRILFGEYKQIIDWYPSDEELLEQVKINDHDSVGVRLEKNDLYRAYLIDKDKLETMLVKDVLDEMKNYNGF